MGWDENLQSKSANVLNNSKIMEDKCYCESCDSKVILRRFAMCPKCCSTGFHLSIKVKNGEKE